MLYPIHVFRSPAAKGLFHKAICQSGSPFTHTEHSAEKVTDAIAKKLLWRRHHFEKNALDQVRFFISFSSSTCGYLYPALRCYCCGSRGVRGKTGAGAGHITGWVSPLHGLSRAEI